MNAAKDFARMYMGMDTDLSTLGSMAVGCGPISDIAADSAGGSALVVTNYGQGSVALINSQDLMVDSTIAVYGEPMCATVADNLAYVAATSANDDTVSVVDIDTRAVTAMYTLDLGVTALAVSPDRKHLYVSRAYRGRADIAIVDPATDEFNAIEIATGAAVTADVIRVSPDGDRLYAGVCDTGGDRLVVVDPEAAQVVGSVPIGSPIRDVAVSRDGLVYVLTADPRRGGLFLVVDPDVGSITETVEIGGWPTQMAVDPDGTRAYIANRDHVAVVGPVTSELLEPIKVTALPSCVAISPDGSRLYVADYDGVVTAVSIGEAVTLPSIQVMAMDLMPAPEVRELVAAAV